jgi:hypothetical protein
MCENHYAQYRKKIKAGETSDQKLMEAGLFIPSRAEERKRIHYAVLRGRRRD